MDFKMKLLALFFAVLITDCISLPSSLRGTLSLLVAVNEKHVRSIRSPKESSYENTVDDLPATPKIYEMRIDCNVTNRFAQTLVTSKVKNDGQTAQQAVFAVILPEKAFISNFVMAIDGKNYEAYVKEKEQAKQIYNEAVASGLNAAHVAVSARDSNRFTVSVNVGPASKATFFLTYQQLLEREDNKYELVINIHPKQPVKDLHVHVNIKESLPLKFVTAPAIRSGNDIAQSSDDLDPRAEIRIMNETSAEVHFNPSVQRQKELAASLKENVNEGLAGQFVVQYDVVRNQDGGEVLLDDGYFVHFFAPANVKPIPKYVLFVLDTSGSMYGNKINQLKTAMKKILQELHSKDRFHLIDFNTFVNVLDLDDYTNNVRFPDKEPTFFGQADTTGENVSLKTFPSSSNVTEDNIKKANKIVEAMESNGGTNIADALKVALHLVKVEKQRYRKRDAPQPMIIFLTDGDATVGITESDHIIEKVSEQNIYGVPIFSLSFGDGADRSLLQTLSLGNSGFSRHIYEAADASLQLQDFYSYISSPIMSNVTFKYVTDAKNVTKTTFPLLFGGSELVVAGVLDKDFPVLPHITGWGVDGPIDFVPEIKKPITKLERMWAYLTIQQLLEEREIATDKAAVERKALDLALKYSFVTPVSSLVVVKPNSTDSVEPESASRRRPAAQALSLSAASPAISAFAHAGAPAPPALSYDSAPDSHHVQHEPVYYTTTIRPVTQPTSEPSTSEPPTSKPPTSESPTSKPPTSAPPTFKPAVRQLQKIRSVDDLKHNLPWLNETLLNDSVIRTEKGDYPINLKESSLDDVPCPVTPRSGTGFCKLLQDCPEVHYLLTNVHIFYQYHCEMKGLAAICCPKPKVQ